MIKKCEVCGKDGGSIAVVSSTLGPFSVATCRDCLLGHVEPLWAFEATYELCGNEVAKHVKLYSTIIDGVKVSWADFAKNKSNNAAPMSAPTKGTNT